MTDSPIDVASQRREYVSEELRRAMLADEPIRQFERWLREATAQIAQDPTAMTLATVDPEGQPCQRVVLLKGLDQRGFVFFTNLQGRKALHIAAHARVCLHFGWLAQNRQVIVEGTATRVSREEDAVYFNSRPRASQLAAWASRQSEPVADRQALEQQFQRVQSQYQHEEAIPLPAFWGGYRVAPHRVEFWQGRESRLHDRLVYSRNGEKGWSVERLQP
ncbi:MAG TPA: pyridoxamine 5'-phosphate oxidase [Spongiibacteraceae bacterium]|jgi:pyridoxamine 5'-phosphate oxidase|nr:pyridoxamine 5'-phosphate oxidase [Spongiibacteraceae bacterium]HUH36366.1 pyridoxamine 5'-phosphate oxidase [Spongiibacteraceae bacterium]